MSFSQSVKAELCAHRPERKCCALAESYGLLLFCRSFTEKEIKLQTSSAELASRVPLLFRRAFGVEPDSVSSGSTGRYIIKITDPEKLGLIFDAYGISPNEPSLHINFGVIEEDCCRASFIRGAFLAGGSVSDPEKSYHLELATTHRSVSRECIPLLSELGLSPNETQRKGNSVLYLKRSDYIEDFLTTVGAPVCAMELMNARIEKEMTNAVNRKVNCDSANADKIVSAAAEQMEAILRIEKQWGIKSLPDKLREAALLRFANPEASIAELAMLASPPVSKSCLSHRLRKLLSYDPEKP